MSNKITIIGSGSVGSTIAYTMAVTGVASEIVLVDIFKEKAVGEAMDIFQGTPFCSPVNIHAGDYADAADSDIVIITSGIPRKPGQTRLELAQVNVDVIKDITPKITAVAPDAIYIIVSNPVDVLTYVFTKISGIPEHRIIGSGTVLDTARLRAKLAEECAISQKNVHAYVFGEHGDSSFVPWSIATISSIPIKDYKKTLHGQNVLQPELDYDGLEEYVRRSGGEIIKRKGATFYAVAVSVCHVCNCIAQNNSSILTVSSMMHGDYGVEDVCLSTLAVVDSYGIKGKVEPPLTEQEIALLHNSANQLKEIISGLDF